MTALTFRRYADSATAQRYPLPVRGPAEWHWLDGAWRVGLTLPDLPPGTILVPSLALADAGDVAAPGTHHRWVLEAGAASWALQDVPSTGPAPRPEPADPAVSTHIDCYHIHRWLEAPKLHLAVAGSAASPAPAPERYLISVSSRALTLVSPPLPDREVTLPAAPASRSQMTAPQTIAGRICSPTCVSMVLDLWHKRHDWLTLVGECHDPATGTYGVWPLAVQAAARRGCIGAVEVFDDWSGPCRVLAAGVPLVTSIRFSAGELPAAPLAETGGHLVVVYGADPREVLVCDPAAARASEVRRRYDAAAFSRAWLRHRGAAYILPR
jgi:hypothetical protein